jgi:phage-related protein
MEKIYEILAQIGEYIKANFEQITPEIEAIVAKIADFVKGILDKEVAGDIDAEGWF